MDAAVVELHAEMGALHEDVRSRNKKEGAEDKVPNLDAAGNIPSSEVAGLTAMQVGAVAAQQRRVVAVHPPLFAFPPVFQGFPLQYLLEFWEHFHAKPD